ncbi:MAG: VWA domain-containing protein [bacterium]|nr:VWA domain-containing protein [bacterium]
MGWNCVSAQTPPDGLHISKTWTADDPDKGDSGVVTLEAFVTGSSIVVSTVVPTDIVIVVDQSGSMSQNFSGNQTKLQALKNAVTSFVQNVQENASEHGVDHKVAIVGFAMGNQSAGGIQAYYNTEILTPTEVNYQNITTTDWQNALLLANDNGQVNGALTSAIQNISARGGTLMQYGLEMAYNILNKRPQPNYNAGTVEEPDWQPRMQIVVFFTDGYPGLSSNNDYFTESGNYNNQSTADATVKQANLLKTAGAKVFSVGIFSGATPEAAYQTSLNYYNQWRTGIQAANGLMHFVSSNYYFTTTQGTYIENGENQTDTVYISNLDKGWSLQTTQPHLAGHHNNGFYLAASNASQLSSVFTTIANSIASVPVQMDMQTIVQDQISPNFTLPEGANQDSILVYAPRCIGVNTAVTPFDYSFDSLHDGVKIDGAVTIINDLIRITGFDFSEMWCGLEGGDPTRPHGRKLVIQIPLKIQEGVWGDGLPTNGPMSLIFPNGDTLNPIGSFPIPTATVKGDVWTEIVVSKPNGFDPMNIDSPEDLAWFISEVNGRANYSINDTVRPKPSLNGKLTADLDMSAHNWIPIGSNGVTYTGTFDGNGHVITGLKNNASKFYKHDKNVVVYPGMFGTVSGTVHDVFVLDSEFRAKKHEGTLIHYGIIIDTLAQGGVLYNSEAAGRLMTNNEAGNETLILGGLVGLNLGEVHSCMSMAQLTGFTMGGAVGELESNAKFENGFINPQFNYIGTKNQCCVGGFIGVFRANAVLKRVYARFERENKRIGEAKFGRFVGLTYVDIGSDNQLFNPNHHDEIPEAAVGEGPTTGNTMLSYSAPMPKYLYNYNSQSDNTWQVSMIHKHLNKNLPSGYSQWRRTTAGNYSEGAGDINDDYPILSFNYPCVASTDGIALDYAASLSDMLKRHNKGNLNEKTQLPHVGSGHSGNSTFSAYKKTEHPAIYGGTINLRESTDNTEGTYQSTADNVTIYFYDNREINSIYQDVDVSLLCSDTAHINAYTCQTLKTFCDSNGERWHNVSSSLANSEIGISYTNNDMVPHSWDNNPCGVVFSHDDDYALFPSDAPVSAIDFYCFYEPQYHWLNFRRNSSSHWHMDNYSENIPYTNETALTPGKGYLMAIGKDQFLQNRGILNNGEVLIDVSADAPEWTGLKGYNLIGNPYQSYLDFDAFVDGNPDLWEDGDTYAQTYALYDPNGKGYIQYAKGASAGGATASRNINMHQGFFILVSRAGTCRFSNAMRTNTRGNGFRTGEQPRFPLVNFTLTDSNGNTDVAVLEVGRSENGGGKKLRVGSVNGRISLRHDNKNFAILFRDITEGSQTLNFAAEEDGNFTLSWNTANAEFSSLTLVDNITGIKTDMLTHDHYTFEGRVDDYNTRFKIVFGEIVTNDEEEPILEHFAFFDNGNLIVNGTGHFEVVDVLGRVVYATELTDTQNTVSLPSNVRGVCMLCLTRNNETKVIKMVIQ